MPIKPKTRAITAAQKAIQRQRLLDAALTVFYKKGYTAARLDDIASLAGSSKGMLYLYFDNKQAIFLALIEQLALPNLKKLQALFATNLSTEQIFFQLYEHIAHMIVFSPFPKLLKIIIGESQAFPDIVTHYRQNFVEVALTDLSGWLHQSHANGELNVPEPMITAKLMLAPVVFNAIEYGLFYGKDSQADLARIQTLLGLHARLLYQSLKPSA